MAKFAPTVPRLGKRVFMITATDAPGTDAERAEHLDAHLEYVEKHCEQYLICGPVRAVGEQKLAGSFFLVAAADENEAEAIVSGDPYFQCGLYGSIDRKEFTASAGKWMGGVIWESADEIRAYANEARPVENVS
ncbi:MAG: YciI family protein [Pseudomonadota bacterium]